MKVYNQDKTQILETYDLSLGKLVDDTITITQPEVEEVEEQGHYEIIAEYSNGGKDVKWVVDVEGVAYQPAKTYEENILVYIPYTQDELLNLKADELRVRREVECFAYINRGVLWYNMLTIEQQQELNTWYQAWLNVPQVYLEAKPNDVDAIIPQKPNWLK